MTRSWLFGKGYTVTSAHLGRVLDSESLVPTKVSIYSSFISSKTNLRVKNTFSQLAGAGFDYFKMFVPDVLHEFELGVWKAIFIHLMRILYANGNDAIQTLNRR